MSSLDLNADCASCMALCCVAFELERCESFAIDKPAGEPCPNLRGHRCSIHSELHERGFSGCAQFDCHGAGQRCGDDVAAFFVLLEYHQLLWMISRVQLLVPRDATLRVLREEVERACGDVRSLEPLTEARVNDVHTLLRECLRYKRQP